MRSNIIKKVLILTSIVVALVVALVDAQAPSESPTKSPTIPACKKAAPKEIPSIYGEFKPEEPITQFGQQAIVSTLIAAMFVLMAFEVSAPEVIFLAGLVIVTFCEIITLPDALSGFSNAALITIGSLYIVTAAVERSHVVDWLARKAFGSSGSARLGQLRLYSSCFVLSTFFNNTPLVALLMPVVKDWGRMRGIGASQLLMPLSYAVLAGSFGSMIGTSTNLSVQGLMLADRGYEFSFFAPLPIGVICFVFLTIYMVLCGPYILPTNKSGLIREARDKTDSLIAEVYVSSSAQAVGRSVGQMMTSIGLSSNNAIKIRRRVTPLPAEVNSATSNQQQSSDFHDSKYVKVFSDFWKSNSKSSADSSNEHIKVPTDVEEVRTTDEFVDIVVPAAHEILAAGDIVFISSAKEAVAKILKTVLGEGKGLVILNSDVMSLPGFGTELVECVISDSNPHIGSKVSEIASTFSQTYKLGLVTVRGKDWGSESTEGDVNVEDSASSQDVGIEMTEKSILSTSEEQKPSTNNQYSAVPKSLSSAEVGNHKLACGDTILCVVKRSEIDELTRNRDFFVVSAVGSLPTPISIYSFTPVLLFALMLVVVALEYIDICPASMLFAALCLIGGWVKPEEIPKYVDMRLLMLLGASLSFSISMTRSGLAVKISESIGTQLSPFGALLTVYGITLVITEIISNNAAAALMYPIAVGIADELKLSFKPFAMTVLVASTAGFMSPIGYQTHLMVWGPGGYKFKDFIVFGVIPDLMYLFIGCAVIFWLYDM